MGETRTVSLEQRGSAEQLLDRVKDTMQSILEDQANLTNVRTAIFAKPIY